MTRIEKSEAQLDAEAGAVEYSLRWHIIDLRRALMMETPSRLHQRSTSTNSGDELDDKGWPKDADEGGVGVPFSAAMHVYLQTSAGRSEKHPWDLGPNPRNRPAQASIQNESERCHACHTSHLRPGYTLSLCAEMMSQVGRLGQEPTDLAWHFGLPLAQVEKMLLETLKHARNWREGETQRLSRMVGAEEPLPERRPIGRSAA